MAKKQVADVMIHAADSQESLEDDGLDVSVDCIEDGLYLGNLGCARDYKALQKYKITHILTIDVVPLPRTVLDHTEFTFKFVKLADVPKEDLISQLPETNEFIKQAIEGNGRILVHCYFGVSRSAAVVIAFVMEKYGLCYDDAFAVVKAKRRFICPNVGFVAQLKLFGHMGYKLNKDDPRFKQFRLKMAGQKLKQVKILPQTFADLIKPDPGVVRERPEPVVYRCRKCRRVLASQANIIPHLPRDLKVQLAKKDDSSSEYWSEVSRAISYDSIEDNDKPSTSKKNKKTKKYVRKPKVSAESEESSINIDEGIRPPPNKLTGLNCAENGEILLEKLKNLACQILDPNPDSPGQSQSHSDVCDSEEGSSQYLDGYHETTLVDGHVGRVGRAGGAACRLMWFVEPLAWMQRVTHDAAGKLHCPKCKNKVGSFNWLMGCKCPCGQKVAPAFYLVPSKVEWSNIVQNVQVTV